MHPTRKLLAAFAACLFGGSLGAQSYVGNLNGTSPASTFEVGSTNSLPTLGWTGVTGLAQQFTNANGNGEIIGQDPFANYAVQYATGTTLQANSLYTLSFVVGYVSAGTTGTADYTVTFGTSADSGSTINNALSANSGALTATINRASGGAIQDSLGNSALNSQAVSITFLTGASVSGDSLYLRLAQSNQTGSGAGQDYFGFDNVVLSVAAIPEPSTYAALLGLGALGFAARRRLSHRLRPAVLGFMCLAGGLSLIPAPAQGQTFLLNENFENPTIAGIPTGWSLALGSYDNTTANPSASGINLSANVLTADSLSSRVATPTINLNGLVGQTFTLEFDLYNPTQTTSHGVIIGYGPSGVVDVWAASSGGGTGPLGGGQAIFNLSAPATWQHFSIDVTAWVNAYDAGPGDLSLFSLSFQDWSTPTLVMSSLDNVTLTAVPEPSTYALLAGFAALGLAGWYRRRRAGSA